MSQNPFELFETWFKEALEHEDSYPESFSLATANAKGWPSVRTLLLKKTDHQKFIFFTNYLSLKSSDLSENPKAEMLFYWKSTKKQIRIQGTVIKAAPEVSDDYWESRDYLSRLNSYLSHQSAEKSDDFNYAEEIKKLKELYPDRVPRPKTWGGFVLTPHLYEFWKEGENRWHYRFTLEKNKDGQWEKTNLFP